MTELDGAGPREQVLDLLAGLGELTASDDLDEAVRDLLELLASATGLESVYLTRIDWDSGTQVLEAVRNADPDVFAMEEGRVLPWEDTLCRRAMSEDWGWETDVRGHWPDAEIAAEVGITSLVSAPVVLKDGELPYGTLCAVSPRALEPDGRVVALLRLLADVVGDLLGRDAAISSERARAERAEERLAERIRFAAQVEHGLRAPLAVLSGWITTLQDERMADPDLRRDGLAAAARSLRTLGGRVDELLVESRLAVREVQQVPVDVRALVEEVTPQQLSSTHPIRVEGELTVASDPVVLAVLLEHLVENAVRHTPDGTEVRVLLASGDEGATMTVEDDGPGLPDRDDLFEPFVTADPDPARRGTGLGLHIVRELAAQLGVTVEGGNGPSGGARFVVTVPRPTA